LTVVDPGQIVRRLVDARLLSLDTVVDGDLTLRNVSRSNGVFLVWTGERVRYVVKTPLHDRVADQGSADRERAFYERLGREPGLPHATPVPRLVANLEDLLVLAAAGPGETLEDRYRRSGLSAEDAAMLGHAMGAWRRLSAGLTSDGMPGHEPWILSSLTPTPPAPVQENAGASQLAETLRARPALTDGLDRLRSEWRRDGLIHGDLRWDNAVVEPDPSTGWERVILVDWEFIDVGDFGWDMAGAMADAVAFEAASGAPAEPLFQLPTAEDLAALRSALAGTLESFATAYRKDVPEPGATCDLEDGARFLPARVLQIGFLHAAWGLDPGMPSALTLAGLAETLFEEPDALTAAIVAQRSVPAGEP
jgi:Ser/Thr protein kinase RdoA (MazF antagonist)